MLERLQVVAEVNPELIDLQPSSGLASCTRFKSGNGKWEAGLREWAWSRIVIHSDLLDLTVASHLSPRLESV